VTKTFAAIVAAFALATSAAAATPPAAPITLPAKPGNVTFTHAKHSTLKCTTCHKSDEGGKIEGFGATVNKDKAHATCHECHKKEGKGPQKCGDCHKK
jgi:hypothetical protein